MAGDRCAEGEPASDVEALRRDLADARDEIFATNEVLAAIGRLPHRRPPTSMPTRSACHVPDRQTRRSRHADCGIVERGYRRDHDSRRGTQPLRARSTPRLPLVAGWRLTG